MREKIARPQQKGGPRVAMDMQSYLSQQQSFFKQQEENQQRLQALDQSRLDGITAAKAREASTKQLMQVRTRATWAGLKVLAVVSFVILMFLYNSVFANDKRMFWVITVLLMGMLIWKFVEVVRNDGALAIGHLSTS